MSDDNPDIKCCEGGRIFERWNPVEKVLQLVCTKCNKLTGQQRSIATKTRSNVTIGYEIRTTRDNIRLLAVYFQFTHVKIPETLFGTELTPQVLEACASLALHAYLNGPAIDNPEQLQTKYSALTEL